MWIGRGDVELENWEQAVTPAVELKDGPTPYYLLRHPWSLRAARKARLGMQLPIGWQGWCRASSAKSDFVICDPAGVPGEEDVIRNFAAIDIFPVDRNRTLVDRTPAAQGRLRVKSVAGPIVSGQAKVAACRRVLPACRSGAILSAMMPTSVGLYEGPIIVVARSTAASETFGKSEVLWIETNIGK
jgi:hypothetical protein